ncbi:MAG TPA: hypothetical protein PK974_01395 [Rhodocyclaceae bacterium]|nr:hypothetical protein [Rhodocyclaceae bacterium]
MNEPIHHHLPEHRPFRFWTIAIVCWLVVALCGFLAWGISEYWG